MDGSTGALEQDSKQVHTLEQLELTQQAIQKAKEHLEVAEIVLEETKSVLLAENDAAQPPPSPDGAHSESLNA